MSDQRFAQDVHQTFADAGSFYISAFKGKAREQAVSFVGTGLATSLQNNIDNVIHNLINDDKHIYKCVDYDFKFRQTDISINDTLQTVIYAPLDIDISSIDVNTKDQGSKLLLAGVHFIQEIDEEQIIAVDGKGYANPRCYKYKSIKFTDNSIIKQGCKNLVSFNFNINGTYTKDSAIRNFLLKSYIHASHAPLGQSLTHITNYIGGSQQDINDFIKFINAIGGATYFKDTNIILAEIDFPNGLAINEQITITAKVNGYSKNSKILNDLNVVTTIRRNETSEGESSASFSVTEIQNKYYPEIIQAEASYYNNVTFEWNENISDYLKNELTNAVYYNIPFGYNLSTQETPIDTKTMQYQPDDEASPEDVMVSTRNGDPTPAKVAK